MDNYQQNLAKLSQEARDYFNSTKSIDLNLLICSRNGLTGENIGRNTDLISGLFFKEIALEELVSKIKEVFKFNDAQAKKLAADIAGIRLLVVDQYFGGKVGEYLKSLGAPLAEYQKITSEQIAAVKKEKADDAAEAAEEKAERERLLKEEPAPIAAVVSDEEGEFKPDWEKEKKETVEMFKEDLAGVLSFTPEEEDFNDTLVYLLAENGEELSKILEKAMLGNNETLTGKPFTLAGRPVRPTIANWLAYFIKEKGSGKFDNIVLTDFLVRSDNTKNLSNEEKNAVKKLILLYRNLKFFPDSMPNKTGEGWQIIPAEVPTGEKLAQAKEKVGGLAQKVAQPEINAKPSLADDKKTEEKEDQLEQLKKMAEKYPLGSMQRRAVESEIKKLGKK